MPGRAGKASAGSPVIMKRRRHTMPHLRRRIGFGALLATVAAMLGPVPAIAGVGGPGYFPNVPLTTQDGKVVHFYDDLLKGKSVVINLIYTQCSGSCPLETARLSQVHRLW